MANVKLEESFDKFDNTVTISTEWYRLMNRFLPPESLVYRMANTIDKNTGVNTKSMGILFQGDEFKFFIRGNLYLHLDGEYNIILEPCSHNDNVLSDGGGVTETVIFLLSDSQFERICQARTCDIRITAKRDEVEVNNVNLPIVARALYRKTNNDENAFIDIDNEVVSDNTSSGCLGSTLVIAIGLICAFCQMFF